MRCSPLSQYYPYCIIYLKVILTPRFTSSIWLYLSAITRDFVLHRGTHKWFPFFLINNFYRLPIVQIKNPGQPLHLSFSHLSATHLQVPCALTPTNTWSLPTSNTAPSHSHLSVSYHSLLTDLPVIILTLLWSPYIAARASLGQTSPPQADFPPHLSKKPSPSLAPLSPYREYYRPHGHITSTSLSLSTYPPPLCSSHTGLLTLAGS